MRKYELTVIFPAKEDVIKEGTEAVKAELAKQNATIVKEDDMNERELAYEIKKNKRGHYFLFTIEIDPANISPAEKTFLLTPSLLKFLFVRVDA
jgi:small subunit ribosomal protein S6